MDNPYHHVWSVVDCSTDDWFFLNASEDPNIEFNNSAYKPLSTVLKTAMQPFDLFYSPDLNWTYHPFDEFYVYLHFVEIQKLPTGHKRIINVNFGNMDSPAEIVTLEYLRSITRSPTKPIKGYVAFTFKAAAAGSHALPILNALEIYKLLPQPNSLTDEADVDAVLEIKLTYGISKINWQGDPCAPLRPSFRWDGLDCSTDKIPRIISFI